jgi:hypothetical protein
VVGWFAHSHILSVRESDEQTVGSVAASRAPSSSDAIAHHDMPMHLLVFQQAIELPERKTEFGTAPHMIEVLQHETERPSGGSAVGLMRELDTVRTVTAFAVYVPLLHAWCVGRRFSTDWFDEDGIRHLGDALYGALDHQCERADPRVGALPLPSPRDATASLIA